MIARKNYDSALSSSGEKQWLYRKSGTLNQRIQGRLPVRECYRLNGQTIFGPVAGSIRLLYA